MATLEKNFINRVNKLLPETMYAEKMANPYRRGTPDVWYAGTKNDIWVEYKYKNVDKLSRSFKNPASPAQIKWLEDSLNRASKAYLVIGYKKGLIVVSDNFNTELIDPTAYDHITIQEFASWIVNTCHQPL